MSTPETWDDVYGNFGDFNPIDQAFYDRLTNILSSKLDSASNILEVGSGSGILVSFFRIYLVSDTTYFL